MNCKYTTFSIQRYCFFRKSVLFPLVNEVYIALREGDGDAVVVQGVVDQLLGTVDVTDTLHHQHLLLHGDGDRAVVHVLQRDGDAAFRIYDVAPERVLGAKRFQGLAQHLADPLDISAISHAHGDLHELVGVVAGEVAEVLGKQCGVQEGHLGTIDGLDLGALVADMGDLAADAVANDPVADAQTARHQLDAVDEVVQSILQRKANARRETAGHETQRAGGDVQRQHYDDNIHHPYQDADDAVAQRQVDLVVADALAVVFLHEEGVADLLPDGVQGSVDISEHEEQADQDEDAVERQAEGVGSAGIDELDEVLVIEVVVQILEVEHVECQMEAEGDRQDPDHGKDHLLDEVVEPSGTEHQGLLAGTGDEVDA